MMGKLSKTETSRRGCHLHLVPEQALPPQAQPPQAPPLQTPPLRHRHPGSGPEAATGGHFRRGVNDVEHFHVVLPFVAVTVTLTVRFGVAPEM